MLFSFLHLLSLALWIGTILFFSAAVAPTLFKKMGKEEGGKVVSLLFPVYFRIGILCGLTAVLTLLLAPPKDSPFPIGRVLLLVIMTTITVYNTINVYPKARSLKEELGSTSEETLKPSLLEEFHRAHQYSVALNVVVLVLGLIVLFLMSRT
ncbi:MAG: DUF4149 domain-containing protein [Deltaproteobacteria bacterium]|nr:DUF4149 domain-containing protein [Deltaproteobacteria bacterium]